MNQHRSQNILSFVALAFIVAALASSVVPTGAAELSGDAGHSESGLAAGQYTVYLPLLSKGGGAPPPPPPPPPPTQTPPPTGADGAFFFETNTKTASSNVAVDAQGGTHMVYYYYISQNAGGANVVYSYCPPPASQCTTESAWRRVRLFGPVNEVQLQLTPDGKPRILAGNLGARNSVYLRTYFTYAECNENCLDAASWASTEVDSVMIGYIPEPRETPRRYFALNRLGQPYFVASDRGSNVNNESRYGGFLYGCTANCTDAASWSATRFTPVVPGSSYSGTLDNAVLRFTSTNQPRILGEYYPASSEPGSVTQITYFACDSGCDDGTNWSSAPVSPRGNGPKPAWDLELTPQDQPRAVVFHQETRDEREKRLFYFQCDADCTSAAWTPVNLELPQGVGVGADLELDGALPRIAHLGSNGALVYSWCESSCADTTKWLHAIAEKPETLDAANGVVIPSGCVAGLWDNYGVSLALDPQGSPRISYDATYQAQCAHSPVPGEQPTAGFYEIGHLIRLFFSPKP